MGTHPLSEARIQEAVDAWIEHGSQEKAAEALGISRGALQNALRKVRAGDFGTKPVLPGFGITKTTAVTNEDGEVVREFIQQKPLSGDEFEVPQGHQVKGISALVDQQGRIVQQWVKTRLDDPQTLIEALKNAFLGYKPTAKPTKPPRAPQDHLLNLVPCNDWHINLLVWGREASENWDLAIAETVIGAAIDDAILRSPVAGHAIVLGGGDLLHADTNENRTAKSANILDADGRHQKGLEVAIRLMVRTVDRTLERALSVTVRILKGNHDEYSSVAVGFFLSAYYRNEPRVTVDLDPSLFFWFRWGKVLLGATHGHTVKLDDMAGIMAHRRAEDWGATRYRYVHGFHVHHKSKFASEGGGVIMESHQAPIPQDAWHFGAGYLSGRSVQTITYHNQFGEVSRVRVAIQDAEREAA